MCTGRDALAGHTNTQKFKFYRNGNGWPLMQYKFLYTNNQWLPKEGGGIQLRKETKDGSSKVPCEDPKALKPHSDLIHPNCIWMQYWTSACTHYVDAETYEGWNSTCGNI